MEANVPAWPPAYILPLKRRSKWRERIRNCNKILVDEHPQFDQLDDFIITTENVTFHVYLSGMIFSTSLVLLCLAWLSFTVGKDKNLLFIGDSLDRFFSVEWCEERQHAAKYQRRPSSIISRHWDADKFQSLKDRSFYCYDPSTNDSVALFRVFGSKATGPYYKRSGDPLIDTIYRIPAGLNLYFNTFGVVPDRIIFHTSQWDQRFLFRKGGDNGFNLQRDNSEYARNLKYCEEQTHLRLNEIINITSMEIAKRIANESTRVRYQNHKVDIGLRTTTWNSGFNESISDLNNVVRRVAADRNLTFYDLDLDIWSTVNFEYRQENEQILFRDFVHPSAEFSYGVIERLLNNRHSQFFRDQSKISSDRHAPENIVLTSLDRLQHTEIKLLRAVSPNTDIVNTINLVVPPNAEHHPVNHSDSSFDLPGSGPMYYSAIIDGNRYKWTIVAAFDKQTSSVVSADASETAKRKLGEVVASEKPQQHGAPGHKKHFSSHNMSHNMHHKFHNMHYVNQYINSDKLLPFSELMKYYYFTQGDLALLPSNVLESIPTLGVMPMLFNNSLNKGYSAYNATHQNVASYIVMANDDIYKVPDDSYFADVNITAEDTTHIDNFWFTNLVHNIQTVPDLSVNRTMYRFEKGKSINVAIDSKRYSFGSMKVLAAHGFDIEDDPILVIKDSIKMFAEHFPYMGTLK